MKLVKSLAMGSIVLLGTASAWGANYVIDTKGAHAAIDFRFKHLNISWLTGRFNEFSGTFVYDEENPAASSVEVSINTKSLDSNHAERDKHIRSSDFMNTDKYPTATFVSSSIAPNPDGTAKVTGDLTLHGVTKEISFDASLVGKGKDPWGGYRAGFEATFLLNTMDFGMKFPPTNEVELTLLLEGIRQ